MAIKTSKTFKVVQQASRGAGGIGTVKASFSTRKHGASAEALANEAAATMADAMPGTRFYVMATTRGVYRTRPATLVTRTYA